MQRDFQPTHVSHKLVEAHPIAAAEFEADGSGKVALKGGGVVTAPPGFASRGSPAEGDMLVRYAPTAEHPDGYLSHSPRAVFDDGHRPFSVLDLSAMSFGQAIEQMKLGARVCRRGWNGKGMWLALTPGSTVPATAAARAGALLAYVEAEPVSEVRILPHVDMRAADGSLVIGWLASQTDMLADDWMVVPDLSHAQAA